MWAIKRYLFVILIFGGCLLYSRIQKKVIQRQIELDFGRDFFLIYQRLGVLSIGLSLFCFINLEIFIGVIILKCDLSIKSKIFKFLRENIGEYLYDLVVGKVFVNKI